MKRKLSMLFALALVAVTVFSGCGAKDKGNTPATSAGGEAAGGTIDTFTVALDTDIIALDPAFAYDWSTNPVINQITEPLLVIDENNQIQPGLAKSWEQKDDTTYVYQIRDDVTFSDGTPMTMDDVLFSIERIRAEETASYVKWLYDSVDTIEQTGDWELTVKLSAPSATWKYTFGTSAGHIISKAYYEQHKDDFGTSEGGLMGTGPFVFDSWTSGQEIVLTKSDNYWDKSVQVDIQKLVFKIIAEDTTRVAALSSGQADFTPITPSDMVETVKADDSLEVKDIRTMGISYLAFNTQRAPFDDVNVRQAISYAIDRQALKDNITKDTAEIGTTLPNSDVLFTANPDDWNNYVANAQGYTYDVEKAKECMSKSAYPDGFTCTLLCTEASVAYSKALAIQEYLKEINIDVQIEKLSSDEHTAYQFGNKFDENGKRDYDMILAGWEADYPDVSGNIQPLYYGGNAGEGGSNAAAYVNPEVDKLIEQQAASKDDAERNDCLFKAMDIATADAPYLAIDYPVKASTLNKKYVGVSMNSSWIWNLCFKNVHLR